MCVLIHTFITTNEKLKYGILFILVLHKQIKMVVTKPLQEMIAIKENETMKFMKGYS